MQACYSRWLWASVFAVAFLAFSERSYAGEIPCKTNDDCLNHVDGDHRCVEFFCNHETYTCDEKPIPDCVVPLNPVFSALTSYFPILPHRQ